MALGDEAKAEVERLKGQLQGRISEADRDIARGQAMIASATAAKTAAEKALADLQRDLPTPVVLPGPV